VETGLKPGTATLIEKAANDAGFDLAGFASAGWLSFSGTHAPLQVWVGAGSGVGLRLAVSMASVADLLITEGGEDGGCDGLPPGVQRSLLAAGVQPLYALLRRAFALSRSLPDTPLQRFKAATANMPRSTEAERLVVQRVGQDCFREALLDYWGGRCAVTGLAVPELLRASHIKPWADCETDAERLDVFNGLLLAPHLDAVFDRGLITVGDDGGIDVSAALPREARTVLGLEGNLRIDRLVDAHRAFLPWHRSKVFKAETDSTKKSE
jgi:hypothetical protein